MSNYPELNLPAVALRLQREDNVVKVFDRLRKKWVVLTPEEWVRQHFAAWLLSEYHYPESLTGNERGIELNGMRRRCDIVVFRKEGTPLLIVECKAPDVPVTQTVFDQIVRYNMVLRAEYLVVTNGINHYCCKIDYHNNTYHFIPKIPDYRELLISGSDN